MPHKRKANKWYQKVNEYEFDPFIIAANSIQAHQDKILNYFIHRNTNSLAENFNGKIKAFRTQFRGIVALIFA